MTSASPAEVILSVANDLLTHSERRDVTQPRRIETAQPVEEPRRRLITASDFLNAITLAA